MGGGGGVAGQRHAPAAFHRETPDTHCNVESLCVCVCVYLYIQSCPVANDSVSELYRGPKIKRKIKEIDGSHASKRAPSENGP
jgi:hypothetical protein